MLMIVNYFLFKTHGNKSDNTYVVKPFVRYKQTLFTKIIYGSRVTLFILSILTLSYFIFSIDPLVYSSDHPDYLIHRIYELSTMISLNSLCSVQLESLGLFDDTYVDPKRNFDIYIKRYIDDNNIVLANNYFYSLYHM